MVAKPCLDSAALPRLGGSVRGDAALTITKVIGFRWDLGDAKLVKLRWTRKSCEDPGMLTMQPKTGSDPVFLTTQTESKSQ